MTEDQPATRDQLLSRAYSASQRDLREAHPEEFNKYMEKHTAALGIDWKPKLTEEQRAEQEFQRLLEANPWLRAKFLTPAEEPGSIE